MTENIQVGCGKAGPIHCMDYSMLRNSNAIAENYVYSRVTEQLKETINKNHLRPKFASIEFSEDRRYYHAR